MALTPPASWALNEADSVPAGKSHSLTVPSVQAVTARLPFALRATRAHGGRVGGECG